MNKRWLQGSIWFGISLLLACSPIENTSQPLDRSPGLAPSVEPSSISDKKLEYDLHQLPHSVVHTLKIPAQSHFVVTPAVSNTLQTVEAFAESTGAIAVLNGGFFDPENQKTTSAIVLQGKQVAKPEENERLMTNPNLLPYLDRILNRTEFRQYQCGRVIQYAIALRQELPPSDCQLEAALGGGPRLLPNLTLEPEGFLDIQQQQVIRDALSHNQRNARTAVGLTADGSLIWVMAAQRPEAPENSGLSLPELADLMKALGVVNGMNLDGGSSSALYYQGASFYGTLNQAGEAMNRPVKSVLTVHIKKPGV